MTDDVIITVTTDTNRFVVDECLVLDSGWLQCTRGKAVTFWPPHKIHNVRRVTYPGGIRRPLA